MQDTGENTFDPALIQHLFMSTNRTFIENINRNNNHQNHHRTMRSFLIRDILSGPAAAAASAVSEATGGGNEQQHQASSSFDCAAAQTLAATQARFLAKLAEHQQQVQASKYYEQLQQQHHQLINLNLNHHHLQLQQQLQHQQQLKQQQPTQQQQQQLQLHHHHQHNQLLQLQQSQQGGARNGTGNSSNGGGTKPEMAASGNKKLKTSSFAYDCTSPISSISDVERVDDDEDDDEDGDDDDGNEDERGARGGGAAAAAAAAAGDDDDNEEIEVEKLPCDVESDKYKQRAILRKHKPHRGASGGQTRSGLVDVEIEDADGDEDDEDAEVVDDDDDEGDDDDDNVSNRINLHQRQQLKQQQQLLGKQLPAQFQLNSPLDALFQMTSSTFDALKRGEKRKDREAEQLGSTNFTSKQTSKKKRKSRTAFTNTQIYELERRFGIQKYLSPTDRDEIAMTLNLSNAQVITWFQNRRAKLKRDMEEQKRDIETANMLSFHKSFLESFQALTQMKTAIKPETICRGGETSLHNEQEFDQLNGGM